MYTNELKITLYNFNVLFASSSYIQISYKGRNITKTIGWFITHDNQESFSKSLHYFISDEGFIENDENGNVIWFYNTQEAYIFLKFYNEIMERVKRINSELPYILNAVEYLNRD